MHIMDPQVFLCINMFDFDANLFQVNVCTLQKSANFPELFKNAYKHSMQNKRLYTT